MSVDRDDTGVRRRSVDVGGLALALGAASLGDEGMGKGWMDSGWGENETAGSLCVSLFIHSFVSRSRRSDGSLASALNGARKTVPQAKHGTWKKCKFWRNEQEPRAA